MAEYKLKLIILIIPIFLLVLYLIINLLKNKKGILLTTGLILFLLSYLQINFLGNSVQLFFNILDRYYLCILVIIFGILDLSIDEIGNAVFKNNRKTIETIILVLISFGLYFPVLFIINKKRFNIKMVYIICSILIPYLLISLKISSNLWILLESNSYLKLSALFFFTIWTLSSIITLLSLKFITQKYKVKFNYFYVFILNIIYVQNKIEKIEEQ